MYFAKNLKMAHVVEGGGGGMSCCFFDFGALRTKIDA